MNKAHFQQELRGRLREVMVRQAERAPQRMEEALTDAIHALLGLKQQFGQMVTDPSSETHTRLRALMTKEISLNIQEIFDKEEANIAARVKKYLRSKEVTRLIADYTREELYRQTKSRVQAALDEQVRAVVEELLPMDELKAHLLDLPDLLLNLRDEVESAR